jgi:hypothetical protein
VKHDCGFGDDHLSRVVSQISTRVGIGKRKRNEPKAIRPILAAPRGGGQVDPTNSYGGEPKEHDYVKREINIEY